jgi:signal transduction histidine kinase
VIRVTLEAVGPMLAVAGIMLAILIPLGLSATGRLTRRIVAIEGLVGRIAAGGFGSQLNSGPTDGGDEIDRLRQGVNQMSSTLASLRDSFIAGERQRLLGQLAAGFAHELRNAITGCRLAIDLHRRRCPLSPPRRPTHDDSLAVAIRQLDILEEEVRGLLTVGRPEVRPPVTRFDLATLLADVQDLTGPRLAHAGVSLSCSCPPLQLSARREPLRAAVVNLVLNAIEAAGPGGQVRLHATVENGCCVIAVEDNGSGIPAEMADSISEPFVTGKPEGVGLGLAVAQVVAEERGGRLNWSSGDGLTRFELRLPLTDCG